MKTAKERAEERRREKLAAVVRQMTTAERARYPPRPKAPKQP